MSGLPYESGFEGMFCETSCDECEYYHAQQSLSLNVMIITDKEELMDTVNQGESHRLNIRYTSCEYECSFLVDTFKPDVVIVDCAMPYQKAKDLCQHLYADPRIPRAKIILAMPVKKKNTKLFPGIHTQIKRPFSTKELEAHIEQLNIV